MNRINELTSTQETQDTPAETVKVCRALEASARSCDDMATLLRSICFRVHTAARKADRDNNPEEMQRIEDVQESIKEALLQFHCIDDSDTFDKFEQIKKQMVRAIDLLKI